MRNSVGVILLAVLATGCSSPNTGPVDPVRSDPVPSSSPASSVPSPSPTTASPSASSGLEYQGHLEGTAGGNYTLSISWSVTNTVVTAPTETAPVGSAYLDMMGDLSVAITNTTPGHTFSPVAGSVMPYYAYPAASFVCTHRKDVDSLYAPALTKNGKYCLVVGMGFGPGDKLGNPVPIASGETFQSNQRVAIERGFYVAESSTKDWMASLQQPAFVVVSLDAPWGVTNLLASATGQCGRTMLIPVNALGTCAALT
jgi:hypothetical protein